MKKILSYMLIFALVFSFSTASLADLIRNETVYVNLDYKGRAENIKVVTHISGKSQEEYFVDYGELEDLRVLTKGIEPLVEDGLLRWDTGKIGERGLYYEGKVEKELPLDLEISYYLDGKEIEAQDLAGKSGELEISIEIKNSEDLTSQIQLPLSLDIFRNIQSEKAMISVVGKTMTLVFTHLPMGDEVFKLKAEGENIELAPIIISSTDSSGLLGEGLGGIGQLIDGMEEMSDATGKLEDGSRELGKAAGLLRDGLKFLGEGVTKLVGGLGEIGHNLKKLLGGFEEINGGLGQLSKGLKEGISSIGEMNRGLDILTREGDRLEKGLGELDGGLDELGKGFSRIGEGLEGLNQGHSSLSQLAEGLVHSSDPKVRGLAEAVIKEGKALEELGQGIGVLNGAMGGLTKNTSQLLEGYGQYNGAVKQIGQGLGQFNQEIQSLPLEIEKIYEGHSQLLGGLSSLYGGLDQLETGGNQLDREVKDIPSHLDKIVQGQEEITDGLGKLRKEGLEEVIDGIEKFSGGEDAGERVFTSFVDERNMENSNCQILMQTPSIKLEKERIELPLAKEDKRTFFQRILDLFKIFRK
ncbi:MAG: hypothetical protein WCZ27_02995 [Tissierellaceae bacterium]